MKGPTEFIEFVLKATKLINHYIEQENYTQACYCLGQLNIESQNALEQINKIKEIIKENKEEEPKENDLDSLINDLETMMEIMKKHGEKK